MRKGPPPIPTKIKLLHGNPGKRKLNHNEPKPTPKAPGMPTWLSLEAKAEWRRIVPELTRLGIVTKLDRGVLVGYVTAYARMVNADRMIELHGPMLTIEDQRFETDDGVVIVKTKPVKNPYFQIFRESTVLARASAAELGLTPSSRTRFNLPEHDNSLDELKAILSRPSAYDPS